MLKKLKGRMPDFLDTLFLKALRFIAFGSLTLFVVLLAPAYGDDAPEVSSDHIEKPLILDIWKLRFGDSPTHAYPDFDDSSWKKVTVPKEAWTNVGHPQYGWYRVKFRVSQDMRDQKLGISLGRVGDADELFLNGVKIGQTGLMPPNFRNINHKWRVYELDPEHLNYGGINTVALRVYKEDFHQQGGGLFFGTPQIGGYEKLRFKGLTDYWWTTVKSIIFAFLIFFMFYDFLILWLKNRNSRELFYLGLTSLFFAFISLCQSRFLYEFDFRILYLDKINALSLFLVVFFQTKFFETIFNTKIKALSWLNITTMVIFCLIGFFIPKSSQLEDITQYWILIAMAVFFPYWYYLTFKGFKANKKEAKTIFIGLTFFFSLALNDSLAYWGVYVLYDLVPVGFFGLVLSMRHALALRLSFEREERERAKRWALVGQASSELAHELKNSLNPLRVYNSQLMEKHNNAEFLGEYYETVNAEVDRMKDLVTDILDFARNKTQKTKDVAITKLINDAISKVGLNGKIKVTTEFKTNGAKVFADAPTLIRAFENLIRNAKDAIKNHGEIKISTSLSGRKGKFVKIQISDNGEGIKEDALENIFDPFYTTKAQGTGYGLSIVYKTIKAHDGDIRVESRVNKGTTFTITLPLMEEKIGKTHEV